MSDQPTYNPTEAKLTYDPKRRTILPAWAIEELNQLESSLAACRAELAEARNRIKDYQKMCDKDAGWMAKDAEEIDRLRAEVERLNKRHDEMLETNTVLCSSLEDQEEENLRLKAEVERLTLRWQTGKPPKVDTYWFRCISEGINPDLTKLDPAWWDDINLNGDVWRLGEWAGPIPEP